MAAMPAHSVVAAMLPPAHNESASEARRGLHAVRRWGLIDNLWGRGDQLVSVDHFRHELLMQLRNAADQGATTIVVTSGELCKSVRGSGNSTRACSEAMMAEVKPGDVVLVSSSGAETIIRYRLPRTAQ